MKQLPAFLIISGNGRNTGKTTFACKVIASVSKQYPLTAIKVSPHFHPEEDRGEIILKDKHFIIRKEENPQRDKDSSRMLRAGASQVYYLEVLDAHLEEAMDTLLSIRQTEGPVICESGGMRSFIKPSLFIMTNSKDSQDLKAGFKNLVPLADKIIYFDGVGFDFAPERVGFDGMRWAL